MSEQNENLNNEPEVNTTDENNTELTDSELDKASGGGGGQWSGRQSLGDGLLLPAVQKIIGDGSVKN